MVRSSLSICGFVACFSFVCVGCNSESGANLRLAGASSTGDLSQPEKESAVTAALESAPTPAPVASGSPGPGSVASASASPSPAPIPVASPSPAVPVGEDCATEPETLALRQGALEFPRAGQFVTESHYATRDQKFADGSLFPEGANDRISAHLEASCFLLLSAYHFELSDDCREVYGARYAREWTPPEGGLSGQAARGELKPTLTQELWQGNMLFESNAIPEPGTRYIVTNPQSGKSVVVSMGYEIGPSDSKRWLGGLSVETQWALDNRLPEETELRVGKAVNQSLPYGPVQCRPVSERDRS